MSSAEAQKQTPGPWEFGKERRWLHHQGKSPTGIGYSDTILKIDDDAFRPSDADARLIAAAPDMLAALKALAGPMEAVRDDMASIGIQFPLSHAARAERTRLLVDWIKANADTVDDALDVAFAAIAKAEGC